MGNDKDGKDDGCSKDFMSVGPEVNGYHPFVRHRPGCEVETGVLCPRVPGNDEAAQQSDGLVRLTHETGSIFNVETLYERPRPATDVMRSGPAQIANDSYRDGWDRIFSDKRKVIGQA